LWITLRPKFPSSGEPRTRAKLGTGQAGKAWRGSRGGNALPASRSPAFGGAWGGKRLISASAEKQSPQNDSLIEKIFCARLQKKMKRNFAGFAPPSGGEPPGGIPRAKRAVHLSIFRNFW